MTQWEAAQKLAEIGRFNTFKYENFIQPIMKYEFTPGKYYFGTDGITQNADESFNQYITQFVGNGLSPAEMVVILKRTYVINTAFDGNQNDEMYKYEEWVPVSQKQVIPEQRCNEEFEWQTIPVKNISKLLQYAFSH